MYGLFRGGGSNLSVRPSRQSLLLSARVGELCFCGSSGGPVPAPVQYAASMNMRRYVEAQVHRGRALEAKQADLEHMVARLWLTREKRTS